MSLVERKLFELDGKLAGMVAEFGPWLADTQAGRPLRKHHSQMIRIVDTLSGLVDRVTEERAGLEIDGHDVLDGCRRVQDGILEVYRIWEFFRAKFDLRYHDDYKDFLAIADEFAWACYRPALAHRAATTSLRRTGVEPPLVYLTGDFSPFIHLRGRKFDVEEPVGTDESDEFARVLLSLPVPVVGLPRYQLDHLPDLLLVAHEIGHCVEQDFGLDFSTSRYLSSKGRDIPEIRKSRWRKWLAELFADCYAAVITGPAFVGALADFLALGPGADLDDRMSVESSTTHPSPRLRVAVAAKVLDHAGFAGEAHDIRSCWMSEPIGPFAEDVDVIADVLTSVAYPQWAGRTLLDLERFTPVQQAVAESAAKSAISNQVPGTLDIRALLAGAHLAFHEVPAESARTLGVVKERAVKAVNDAVRSADERGTSTTAADRAAGAALFDRIIDHEPRFGADR